MYKGLLDPKTDFIFKKIFGSEENADILISFLNAIFKSEDKIKTVKIENTDIEKSYLEDKFSRLDIKATTNRNEKINIEIQLRNERNMIKRTLYYWSKVYEEQLEEGKNYSTLNRTVCINILNFNYLKNDKFHSRFRLKDTSTNDELTDIIEIHFIEIPKLSDESGEKDMLTSWVQFLKNPESKRVRNLEDDVKEIRSAKEKLVEISADKKQRELYEMRKKIVHDRINALDSAREDGIEQGIEQGMEIGLEKAKANIAKNLSSLNIDIDTIVKASGLSLEEINKLK